MASLCCYASKIIANAASTPQIYSATSRVLLRKTRTINQNIFQYSCYSVSYNPKHWTLNKNRKITGLSYPAAFVTSARLNSSVVTPDSNVSDYIPAPPEVAESVKSTLETATGLLEPTFASQGLGGWSPVGIIQSGFELVHVGMGMPWWATIVTGTILVRLLMFPLVIKAQQNSAKLHKHMPQMQVLQQNMIEARKSGDQLQALKAGNELAEFVKEKEINPLKQMLIPLCQAPVFISFFISLRQMANLPVESMMHGGLFWFTDLTIADPYYAIPIMTSATLLLTVEIGTDGLRADSMGMMKYFMRGLPLFILPFTLKFPAAILCYWMTSNVLSLIQVSILRIPKVRNYFKIPAIVKHPKNVLQKSKKGFFKSLKDNYSNQKLIKEMEERHRVDEIKFRKAGLGPIEKTYPYDPTKQRTKSK